MAALLAIVSPVRGAKFVRQLNQHAATATLFAKYFMRKSYEALEQMIDQPFQVPTYPCFSISTGLGTTDFDGCVYRGEATIDSATHVHLPVSQHATVFISVRLMTLLASMF